MKINAKQITITAVLLAICIISQFFKNTSIFITGPVINACLILAGLSVGMTCGIILSIITPITSFFLSQTIINVIPAILPCIIIANMILVVLTCLIKDKMSGNAALPTGMIVASISKALFMGIVISLILVPNLLPEAKSGNMHLIQMTFSVFQLVTALIGCVYAYIIWIPLKKVMNEAQ